MTSFSISARFATGFLCLRKGSTTLSSVTLDDEVLLRQRLTAYFSERARKASIPLRTFGTTSYRASDYSQSLAVFAIIPFSIRGHYLGVGDWLVYGPVPDPQAELIQAGFSVELPDQCYFCGRPDYFISGTANFQVDSRVVHFYTLGAENLDGRILSNIQSMEQRVTTVAANTNTIATNTTSIKSNTSRLGSDTGMGTLQQQLNSIYQKSTDISTYAYQANGHAATCATNTGTIANKIQTVNTNVDVLAQTFQLGDPEISVVDSTTNALYIRTRSV